MELSCFSFFHVTVIKSVLAATGAYPQRNFEIQERNGCLPDSTAYDTVMGSKRLTKSSLAQIRNPDLVINLKKEKRNNKDFDIQAVVINHYSLGNVTHPSRLPGRMERPVISNHWGLVINQLSRNCSETRPWRILKLLLSLFIILEISKEKFI